MAIMKRVMSAVMSLVLVLVVMSCGRTSDTIPSAAVTEESSDVISAEPSQELSVDNNVIMLKGTIGGLPVHMSLKIDENIVTGSYYYDKVGKDLRLKGTLEEDRMISLSEYDENDQHTGTFDGWYTHGIRITGNWTNVKTNATLEFSLNVIGGIPANAIWAGEWERMNTGRFNSATLVIYDETKSGFNFQLDAFSGANMGFLDGSAVIDGVTARYYDETTGAEILFGMKDGLVDLTANTEANAQCGMGVAFDGIYTKDGLPEDTLLTQGYVATKAADDAFRAMAGGSYELFLNTAQLRYEEEELDGFGAKVYSWMVRGFAGSNESIVMFLPDGKLCAAVIYPEKNIFMVYTDADYITSVPKTISSWINEKQEIMGLSSDDSVIFKNTTKN